MTRIFPRDVDIDTHVNTHSLHIVLNPGHILAGETRTSPATYVNLGFFLVFFPLFFSLSMKILHFVCFPHCDHSGFVTVY